MTLNYKTANTEECMCDRGPAEAGNIWCAECLEEMGAESKARERRAQAREAAAERRRELAARGCGCASEAECRLWSFDWQSMPKTRAEKLYRELKVSCTRGQRVAAEYLERENERRRHEREAQQQKQQAFECYKSDLRAATLIAPIPSIAAMRETVLAERHDRCPKWRFRLAPDYVVQVQPRPAERRDRFYLFRCNALMGHGIVREHFATATARRGSGIRAVTFGIKDEAGRWRLDLTGVSGFPGDNPYPAWLAAMRLTAGVLPMLTQLNAGMMFSYNCLCCGKELTDPASQARMIGPECAGTSSLDAGMFGLKQPADMQTGLFE